MNPEKYQEVRKFTKENPESQAERDQLAQNVRTQRKEYFSRKGELANKSEELKKQMERKEVDLTQAKEDAESLQESLDKSRESFIIKLFGFVRLRKLKEKAGVVSKLEEETATISNLISELEQQIADKRELVSTENAIGQFYKDKTEAWLEFEKEKEFRSAKYISETHQVLFVHGLLHMRGPVENSALKDGGVDFETKLKILLGLEPTVSVSSVKDGDTVKNVWTRAGVFLKDGTIRNAFPADAGTQVKNLRERSINTYDPRIESATKKDIYGQVDDAINLRAQKEYNEFIIENPEVAGLYVYLQSENDDPYDFNKPQEIPDGMIMDSAGKLNLPVYGLRGGIPCEVRYNEESKRLEYVKDIGQAEILENQFLLNDDQKEDMVKGVLVENSPFKSEIETAIKK